jgi:chromosome segregation ATPase
VSQFQYIYPGHHFSPVSSTLNIASLFRKSDGRRYSEEVSSIKDAKLPFPAVARRAASAHEENHEVAVEAFARTAPSYSEEIAALQARLHQAVSQLEQANSDSVRLTQENKQFKREIEAARVDLKKTASENLVLKRRLSAIEPGNEPPRRPGPSRKSFEDLTPRIQKRASDNLQAEVIKTSEERGILPTRLAAFLTYR